MKELSEQKSSTSFVSPLLETARKLAVPVLSLLLAFAIGSVVVIVSDPELAPLWKVFFSKPLPALSSSWELIANIYRSLILGAVGSIRDIFTSIGKGDGAGLVRALGPISETFTAATPLIFTSLSVALGFHAGLLNIGAEGQLYVGALLGTFIAFTVRGLPPVLHVSLSLVAGFLGGAIWGFIPGILKVKTGAHEVITMMMLNFVSQNVVTYFLKQPYYQRAGRNDPISKLILDSAVIGRLTPDLRLHWGFILSLIFAILIGWVIHRTTYGYEATTLGGNPRAARTAGMKTTKTTVLTMTLCGGLAGLAGIIEILAVNKTLRFGFSPGFGWDALAISVLGGLQPLGIVFASILFGGLRAGSVTMQINTGIPVELISVIQALIILLVASPSLIRKIFHIKKLDHGNIGVQTKGWGSS